LKKKRLSDFVDDPLILLLVALGVFVIYEAMQQNTSNGSTPATPTGPLSASQLAQYAANAGFSGQDLTTAVAIALAESSGNPSAVGDTNITPGGSIGLWQINLQAHPQYSAQSLLDPQQNADAAYAIYQAAGNSFTPWTTYNSGAYQNNLDQASTYLSA
jgi:hypothetical protein